MANHSATIKSIRQNVKRTARNRSHLSRVRTIVKSVNTAVEANDNAKATAALRDAQKALTKAANRGIIKQNTASRTISRLNARIKALLGKK